MLRKGLILTVLGAVAAAGTATEADANDWAFHAQLRQREAQRQAALARARAGGLNGAAFARLNRRVQQQRAFDAQVHRNYHNRRRPIIGYPQPYALPSGIGYGGNPFGGSYRGGNPWYKLTQDAAAGRIPWSEVNRRMYGGRR